jgi:hypothetical protein
VTADAAKAMAAIFGGLCILIASAATAGGYALASAIAGLILIGAGVALAISSKGTP